MPKTMALAVGATTSLIEFDDVNGMEVRPDFHNRRENRAEDGTLYVSIFGQKLLINVVAIMPSSERDQINTWHAEGTSLTFYPQYNLGTAAVGVKLLGNRDPGAEKWTKVGGWYRMRLQIAQI